MKRYQVMVHGVSGHDSPHLNSIEACEKWVTENLPIGVQKCRTGSYSIDQVEGDCDDQDKCPHCGHTAETGACFYCKMD